MKKNDYSYQKQTIECYLVIIIVFTLFFSIFLIAGQLTGTNWIGYIANLTKGISLNLFTFLL